MPALEAILHPTTCFHSSNHQPRLSLATSSLVLVVDSLSLSHAIPYSFFMGSCLVSTNQTASLY